MNQRDKRIYDALQFDGFWQLDEKIPSEYYPQLKTANTKKLRILLKLSEDHKQNSDWWQKRNFQGYAAGAKNAKGMWYPLPKAMARIFFLKLWPNLPEFNHE